METSFTTPINRMKLDTIQQQEKDQSSAYFGSPVSQKTNIMPARFIVSNTAYG